MNENDFILGDYLYVDDWGSQNLAKVTALAKNEITVEYCGDAHKTETFNLKQYNPRIQKLIMSKMQMDIFRVEPDVDIALTNGMKYKYHFLGKKHTVTLTLKEGLNPDAKVKIDNNMEFEIAYVHELQHIMWIAGLNLNVFIYG